MGLMNFVKDQFIDVIEYVDESNKIIVYKYTRPENEIKQGAKVIVRESQAAIFLKGGQLADILPAGTYALSTDNMPVLSALKAFPFGFNSPVKADLYFVSTRQFVDNKWATKNPVIVRDKEFHMARVRAFGNYAFRITDVERFMKEVFGTQGKVMTYDIVEYMTSMMVEAVSTAIGGVNMSILDLAVHYRDLAMEALRIANEKAAVLGMEFTGVVIENISLPDEVEKMIDEQSGIGMAGKDMNNFMKYQSARAMRDAAKQEGGLTGMLFNNTIASTFASSLGEGTKEQDKFDQIREYKVLLDEGIITKEEFDAKKKQLLGL